MKGKEESKKGEGEKGKERGERKERGQKKVPVRPSNPRPLTLQPTDTIPSSYIPPPGLIAYACTVYRYIYVTLQGKTRLNANTKGF